MILAVSGFVYKNLQTFFERNVSVKRDSRRLSRFIVLIRFPVCVQSVCRPFSRMKLQECPSNAIKFRNLRIPRFSKHFTLCSSEDIY